MYSPNVYMVSSAYGGCSYVRILLPAWHNGFKTDEKDPVEVRKALMAADVVVFHRPENKEYYKLAEMLKKDGKKIVMDNDDTFKIDYHPLGQFTPDAIEVNLKKRGDSIDKFLKIADLVTTTTTTLAKEYRKINKNTLVLPNYIDTLDWEEPLRNDTDKVRIGMVGSVAFEYDYLHIKDILRKLGERDDVELIMFGLGSKDHRKKNPNVTKAFKDDYDFWDSVNHTQIPWCPMEEYNQTLNEARLDFMLIPRKDNYFNRCKSNLKFLEAAMCEIPVIAQSFEDGPYEELKNYTKVKGKVCGFLVEDNERWMEYIDNLIDNKELRREIGANAKQYVLDNYNIEDKSHLWEEAYSNLFNNSSEI